MIKEILVAEVARWRSECSPRIHTDHQGLSEVIQWADHPANQNAWKLVDDTTSVYGPSSEAHPAWAREDSGSEATLQRLLTLYRDVYTPTHPMYAQRARYALIYTHDKQRRCICITQNAKDNSAAGMYEYFDLVQRHVPPMCALFVEWANQFWPTKKLIVSVDKWDLSPAGAVHLPLVEDEPLNETTFTLRSSELANKLFQHRR